MTTSTERHFIFVVPGLMGPTPEMGDRTPALPALSLFLSRAERTAAHVPGFEEDIFSLFGHTRPDGDLPVAAVTRVHDLNVIDNEWWLRADPVHLQTQRDGLVLLDEPYLNLSLGEAQAIVAELMQTYAADGWLLKAPKPHRWYLRPSNPAQLNTTTLARVAGRDIRGFLPKGEDAKTWHGLMNEIQILLHTNQTNADRESRQLLAANSLWFWGGGALPAVTEPNFACVAGNEPVSLGLARINGVASIPANRLERVLPANDVGRTLVVLDSLRASAVYQDFSAWAARVEALENEWFAPLIKAVKQGDVDRVSVRVEGKPPLELTRSALRRFWRWRKPFAHFQEPAKEVA
jgi:hypothetical protein